MFGHFCDLDNVHGLCSKLWESSSSVGVGCLKVQDGVDLWRDRTWSQMEVVFRQSTDDSFIYTIFHKDMIIFYFSDD